MSLLAPWALGLAALAALPVVLHLFHRDTRRRLAFPAIRYLHRARDRSARALKLRDRLLLAVRVALVAVLAVAAAGPLLGSGDVSNHEATDVVLVIDNSGSMNRVADGTTLLDQQRGRAMDLIRAARSGDRFWVVPAAGPTLASGVSAAAASQAIAAVQATDAAANLGPAVREALRLLPPGTARPREIAVMTDLQASSLPLDPLALPADVRLVASVTEGEPANGVVASVQTDPPGAGRDGAAYVNLLAGGSATDTVEVRLSIRGQTVSIARAESGGSAILRLPDPGPGEHAISVEIPPSGLRADDRRPFVLRTFAPPVVRHVGPSDSYVARALETLDRAGWLRLGAEPGGADAWFVEGVPSSRLPVEAASTWILTPPEDEGLLARFNATLERLAVPWRIDIEDTPGSTSLGPSPDVPGLESIRVQGRSRLRGVGAGSDTVLVRTADDSPWMVAGRVSGRRYVLMASPLVPGHTELPVTAAMLPLTEVVLFRWAGLGGSLPPPVPAGVAATLPLGADSVSDPAGGRIRVDGGSPYVPQRAGIHTIYQENDVTSLLAAVVPASESDLAAAPAARLTGALGAPEARVARTESEWRAGMYGSRRGTPISPYLAGLALALVLAEAALATAGKRSPSYHGSPRTEPPS